MTPLLQFLSSSMLTAALYDLIGHQAPRVSGKQVAPRHGDVTQNQKVLLIDIFVCVCLCVPGKGLECLDFFPFTWCLNSSNDPPLIFLRDRLFFSSLSSPIPSLLSIYCFVCSGESLPTPQQIRRPTSRQGKGQTMESFRFFFLWGRWRDTGRSDALEVVLGCDNVCRAASSYLTLKSDASVMRNFTRWDKINFIDPWRETRSFQ